MELTPIDIVHVQFKRGIRGYNCSQVDEFVSRIASTLDSYSAERAELKDKVEQLTGEVGRCREIESTMKNALVLAQKAADELKANAHHEAELVMREAEQNRAKALAEAHSQLAALKEQIRLLKEGRDWFESEFRSLLRSCSEWLDKQSSPPPAEPPGEQG